MTTPEVDALLAFARGPRVGGDPFNQKPFRAFFALADGAPPPALDALLVELLPGLAVDDPLHAAYLALTCGTLVEWGASPSLAGDAIVGRLAGVVAAETVDGEVVKRLVIASMAHLCRDAVTREAARRRPRFYEDLTRCAERAPHARYVTAVLELTDRDLTVLAPTQRRGYRVRAEAVRTNFHLFTLLQGALIGEPSGGWLAGAPVADDVLAEATGEARPTGGLQDHQRFHFHDWSSVAPDGSLRGDLRSTLWGEGTPLDIPAFDGEAFVVLGPAVLGSRVWNSGFFVGDVHDALRSGVTVLEQMPAEELDRTLARLAAGAAALPEKPASDDDPLHPLLRPRL